MRRNFNAIKRYMKVFKRQTFSTNLSFKGYRHIPDLIVCLSYSQLYDDYSQVDPKSFLHDIPTFDLLWYILGLENKTHYCLHNPDLDYKIIEKLKGHLDANERDRLSKCIRRHKSFSFINAEGTLRFVRLALSCFTPEKSGFKLESDHIRRIFKAYLYCNQLWTDECMKVNRTTFPGIHQTRNSALIDISLKLEIPYSEFKFFKDYRTQLYKAIKLFEFAEKDAFFAPLLEAFYKDRKVSDWKEYIRIHFGFFESSLKSPAIDMSEAPEVVTKFMEPYLVDYNQLPITDNLKGQMPKVLRTKFLLKSQINPNIILILSSDLLVDKIYQGLKFDFGSIAQKYGIKDTKGKEITQKRINGELGSQFSEEAMLYSVLKMIYGKRADVVPKPGAETKHIFRNDGGSEPDYYLRKGCSLVLFENKDVLFPDADKYSGQLLKLKQSITSKIAKFGKGLNDKGQLVQMKEGLGQIYYNIIRFKDRPDLYCKFDSECESVKKIYPVLVTYDKAYSAIGVNEYINKKVPTIKKRVLKYYKEKSKCNVTIGEYDIQKAIIIDIDTLIMYALLLQKKKLDLFDLIDEYFKRSDDEPNLPSFYTFMMDCHRLEAQGEEFVKLLYGDVLEVDKVNEMEEVLM